VTQILFFTCANQKYEHFVIPWMYSILRSNKNSLVEVGVENEAAFMRDNHAAYSLLQSWFGKERVCIRQAEFNERLPNTVRFVEEPRLRADYVYIGDVDIFILDEDVAAQHLRNASSLGLPYSNMVRSGTKRLTGLHFSEFSAYYPIPSLSDLDVARMNDEQVLYEIVLRKLGKMTAGGFRPVHGIHFSPNRDVGQADGIPGWGVTEEYARKFHDMTQEDRWRALKPWLNPAFLVYVDRTLNYSHANGFLSFRESASRQAAFTSRARDPMTGSTWAATQLIRRRLKNAAERLGISSMLDLGCGPASWILDVSMGLGLYIGLDIVEATIADNERRVPMSTHVFKCTDICEASLPRADLAICRDVLVHLPFSDAGRILAAVQASRTRFFAATTFPGVGENKDIGGPGPWRPLNLQAAPFDLPPPLLILSERAAVATDPLSSKALAIWATADLR
jgi:hypothetical protein